MDESERDTSESGKLLRKMQEDPAVPIGLAGLLGVVSYSLYNLRKKKQKLSIYLIHTRVAAQGTLMACLTIGILYTIVKNNMSKLFPENKK